MKGLVLMAMADVASRPVVPPASPMVLVLFHGRRDPREELNGWGTEGPRLAVWGMFSTYRTLRIDPGEDIAGGDAVDLEFVEDLLHYGGVYYGDWSLVPREELEQRAKRRGGASLVERVDLAKIEPESLADSLRRAEARVIEDVVSCCGPGGDPDERAGDAREGFAAAELVLRRRGLL